MQILKSAQKSQQIESVTFVAMLRYELPKCTPAKFSHLLFGVVSKLVNMDELTVDFVDDVIGVRIVEKSKNTRF